MDRKGSGTIPSDLERVLERHGLRASFEALSGEAQRMYLSWVEEEPDRRRRRVELLVRSLRRNAV
jgi:uncharacterized protein YdeI (YjbR/CyaY-like superfamily)